MKREELESYWDEYGKFWYYKEREADSVMDAMEQRIKSLQEENLAKDMLGAELHNENKELKSIAEKQQKLSMDRWFEIKALKARIAELESDLKTRDLWRENYLVEQKELYERIKELEANQPKWISVKDKLPEAPKSDDLPMSGNHQKCKIDLVGNPLNLVEDAESED